MKARDYDQGDVKTYKYPDDPRAEKGGIAQSSTSPTEVFAVTGTLVILPELCQTLKQTCGRARL